MFKKQGPAFMQEDEARRKKWAAMTGGSKKDNHDMYANGIEKQYEGKIADPGMLRRATEIALESMVQQLAMPVSEGGIGGGRKLMEMPVDKLQEAIESNAIAPFQKVSLGLIRRVMPELIHRSLVSVQVMELPTQPLFYLDYTYGSPKAPTAVGDRIDLIASRNETYAGARFYDEVGQGDGTQTAFELDNALTKGHQVFFNGVVQSNPGITIGAGTGTGGVDVATFAVAPPNGTDVVISYVGYEECDTPRDINLQLTSKTVEAEDHALRAGMTIQTIQNAQAFHSMDVTAELTRAMADELFAEIDALIVRELFTFASAGNVNFNATGYLPGDTSSEARKAYDRTLYDRINDASNLVWTLRHTDPNFIVGGTDAIKRLENLEEYSSFKSENPSMANMSTIRHRTQLGTLGGNRYMVYKDARMPADKLLIGYKGPSPLHTGYIYAPFVMMYQTGLLPDPSANFKMNQGMLHRAGRCRVDMNNYATVTIV